MESRVDTLLTEHGVAYTPAGKDILVRCFSPDHEDKNPSMRIDRLTGKGFCYACGYKIDIFAFYGEIADIVSSAVYKIRKKIEGIRVATNGLPIPKGSSPYKGTYRGISEATLSKYEAFESPLPNFENRIVFPIRDETGLIRAFVGRHLFSDVADKYYQEPVGVAPPMFPFNYSPVKGKLVLVEGIFDALRLLDAGIPNVQCVFGVKVIQNSIKQYIKFTRMRGVTKIFLMFDGDDAGRAGAVALKSIIEGMDTLAEIIDLPEDTDPASLSDSEINLIKKIIL